jgi:ATP-binding cassette subfamily F protein uup
MDKVVDHTLIFKGRAEIQDFPGNYSDYREWKSLADKEERSQEATKPSLPKTNATPPGNDSKKKLSFKEKQLLDRLETEIYALEEAKAALETALCSGTLSNDDLRDKSQTICYIIKEIDEKTARWLELSVTD